MGRVAVACRSCGTLFHDSTRVRTIHLGDESEATYLLDCPRCGRLIVCLVDPRLVDHQPRSWWQLIVDDLRTLWRESDVPSGRR